MFRKIDIAIIFLVFSACSRPDSDIEVKPLGEVEINEFDGDSSDFNWKSLSSISDFQDDTTSGVQHLSEKTYRLKIDGMVEAPFELSYSQALIDYAHYSKIATLRCVDGWEVTVLWEGLRIEDLIDVAGIRDSADEVIFHAADGYNISLPLEYIYDNQILLAYKINGVRLPDKLGFPFKVVAESKAGVYWIKWVTKIELTR